MFESGNPRDAAWAAFTAARDSLRQHAHELVRYLESWDNRGTKLTYPVSPGDAAAQAVADALIQLGAVVPAGTAAKLYPKFPAQALILLSRTEDADGELLRIFDTTKAPIVLLAAGNMLARKPSARFAAHLLDGFTEELVITVVEPGGIPDRSGFGPGHCDRIVGEPVEFRDWPRIREYGLAKMPGGVLKLLAPGLKPVGYWSWTTTDYVPACDLAPLPPDAYPLDQEYRLGLVAQLAAMDPASLPLRARTWANVEYNGDPSYLAAVSAAMAERQRAFEAVVVTYVQKGLLTPQEASGLRPHISVKIKDQRSSREKRPLPPVSPSWF